MLADNRIHVTSSDKISIIAYVSDTTSATDYFLGDRQSFCFIQVEDFTTEFVLQLSFRLALRCDVITHPVFQYIRSGWEVITMASHCPGLVPLLYISYRWEQGMKQYLKVTAFTIFQ